MAVVTNISYDHTEVLGPTLEDIARDKAGIFKAGCRAVVGETDPTLVALFRWTADAAGCEEFWARGIDFACTSNRLAVGGRLVDLRTPGAAVRRAAGAAARQPSGGQRGLRAGGCRGVLRDPLHEDVVEEGLAAVRVPGRLEVIGRHPLVLVDGAHNAAGMMVLARSLSEEFTTDGQTIAVVGMLTGRDPTAMLGALVSAGVRSVVACAPDSPRAHAGGGRGHGGGGPRDGGGPGRNAGGGAPSGRRAVGARRPGRRVRVALRGRRRPGRHAPRDV